MGSSKSFTTRLLYFLMVCITLSYSVPCAAILGMENYGISSIELAEDGEQDSEKEKESENEKEEIKHHLPGSLSEPVAEADSRLFLFTQDKQWTEVYSEITNPPPEV